MYGLTKAVRACTTGKYFGKTRGSGMIPSGSDRRMWRDQGSRATGLRTTRLLTTGSQTTGGLTEDNVGPGKRSMAKAPAQSERGICDRRLSFDILESGLHNAIIENGRPICSDRSFRRGQVVLPPLLGVSRFSGHGQSPADGPKTVII